MSEFPDRSAVRDEFAALLTANMTGPGKLVQSVFPYTVADFGGVSPVLVVGSGGTEQVPMTARGSYPAHLLDLWCFVLYADVDENGALTLDGQGAPVWSEQDSERALDQIETALRELLDGNPRGATWKSVKYAGPSVVDISAVGDQAYRRELFSLRFSAF